MVRLLFVVLGVVVSCGGKVVVDQPAGAGGSTSSSLNATTQSTGDVNPTTGTGQNPSTVGTGGGRPGTCWMCRHYLYECVAVANPDPTCPDPGSVNFCPGAEERWDAFVQCVCVDACSFDCAGSCGQGSDGDCT